MRKVAVWLWYVPIIVILSVGFWMSYQGSLTTKIVDKARSFQDASEASNNLEVLAETNYELSINLDETFTVKGPKYKSAGDLRHNDQLFIPFDITSTDGYSTSNLHLEFLRTDGKPLLYGLNVGVRACATPWKQIGVKFSCSGKNEVRVGTVPMAGSTFPLLNDGQKLKPGQTEHLLIEVKLAKDAILPMEGYNVEVTAQLTGTRSAL